jgi:hypothetical protein
MNNLRKKAGITALILVAVFLLLQAKRPERSNPPVQSDLTADPEVKSLLRRSCYNCHSNETVWPWYSRVAPASWLIASDVNEGRRNLNFSEWASYSDPIQSRKLADIAEETREGEMPPWYYTLAHSDAKLSPSERDRIQAWAGSSAKPQAAEE